MGKFINENTQKFNTESNGQYKNYIKNCLEGFPCVVILNVDYEIAGSTSEYYFLGIYNFNLGRGSYSNLGYVNNSIFNANYNQSQIIILSYSLKQQQMNMN